MGRPAVERYHTSNGARIYRIRLDLFPSLEGYAHLVLAKDVIALVDVGSGFGDSNEQLAGGLQEIHKRYGERTEWETLTHILISHGHIDHFGGLHFVREHCQAPVGIHELDCRVLLQYEDRLTLIAQQLEKYLVNAGVSLGRRERMMDLYLLNKHLFRSVSVDFTFNKNFMQVGPIQIMHVPGHCPGQVVFQIDDILLSSDHVLENTSPHQAPERLSLNTGLGHYLDSLEKIRPISSRIKLVLGGHEGPFQDLESRIIEIMELHQERLTKVMEVLEQPRTIAEVSDYLFPNVDGYHELLAIEETGAHIEYLAQRGFLSIANMDQIEKQNSVPICYHRYENISVPRIFPESFPVERARRDEKVTYK